MAKKNNKTTVFVLIIVMLLFGIKSCETTLQDTTQETTTQETTTQETTTQETTSFIDCVTTCQHNGYTNGYEILPEDYFQECQGNQPITIGNNKCCCHL